MRINKTFRLVFLLVFTTNLHAQEICAPKDTEIPGGILALMAPKMAIIADNLSSDNNVKLEAATTGMH